MIVTGCRTWPYTQHQTWEESRKQGGNKIDLKLQTVVRGHCHAQSRVVQPFTHFKYFICTYTIYTYTLSLYVALYIVHNKTKDE